MDTALEVLYGDEATETSQHPYHKRQIQVFVCFPIDKLLTGRLVII